MERCARTIRLAAIMSLGVLLLPTDLLRAQDPAEYSIKAAMVYNFARFVTWPPAETESDAFRIGVMGDEDFRAAVSALAGKTIGDVPIAVVAVDGPDNLAGCRVVVLGNSATGDVDKMLERLQDAPVLTIGDLDGFAAKGGMIELRRVRNQIRFVVNQEPARRGGLQLSSQLLKLAIASAGG